MATQQPTKPTTAHAGHDAPITTAREDLLGAVLVARAMHRTIRATPTGWSTRIGLYGAWGSGKTSILNLLETQEVKDDSIVDGCRGSIEGQLSSWPSRLRLSPTDRRIVFSRVAAPRVAEIPMNDNLKTREPVEKKLISRSWPRREAKVCFRSGTFWHRRSATGSRGAGRPHAFNDRALAVSGPSTSAMRNIPSPGRHGASTAALLVQFMLP
jgi:hypothetical protein